MRFLPFVFFIFLVSCQTADNTKELDENPTENLLDSLTIDSTNSKFEESKLPAYYSNDRFKDVIVRRLGEDKFLIYGAAQVFEANINWVIEDGHDELEAGFETADAGAPEWGNFSFVVDVSKKRPNSTLHLILFESSAKDGSRQHELPILLY